MTTWFEWYVSRSTTSFPPQGSQPYLKIITSTLPLTACVRPFTSSHHASHKHCNYDDCMV
eukprot:4953129-Amphidinium_carterae.1